MYHRCVLRAFGRNQISRQLFSNLITENFRSRAVTEVRKLSRTTKIDENTHTLHQKSSSVCLSGFQLLTHLAKKSLYKNVQKGIKKMKKKIQNGIKNVQNDIKKVQNGIKKVYKGKKRYKMVPKMV